VSAASPGSGRPAPPPPSSGDVVADEELTATVLAILRAAGLEAVGVTTSAPFTGTRRHLEERRAAGLHGGMAFTYRNPARSTEPARVVDGAHSVVVGALGYARRPPAEGGGGDVAMGPVAVGRVARYAWRDYYADLTGALEKGATVLRAAGHSATVVADSNALVDREAARRAGLGWYGRNSNLLLPGRGSWFVLGSVVTDAVLTPSVPVEPACGACTRCLGSCPTGAIVASGVIDARRCLAWLLQASGPFPWEWRAALGDRMYGCDDCQEVCPPNIVAEHRSPSPPAEDGARASVALAMFLDPDDDAVVAAARRWYVPQRQARYLRRNALVVLGNVGDASDREVVALVEQALLDADPLVRGHAVWAAARMGRPELAELLVATEADPMVREELDRAADVVARIHR